MLGEEERKELEEIYVQKGYEREDAQKLVEIQSKKEEYFVDAMMVHELGMHPDDRNPLLSGMVTFLAFLSCGSVPLVAYFVSFFLQGLKG